VLAGDPAARPLGEDGKPIDIPQGEEVDLAELEAIAGAHSGGPKGTLLGLVSAVILATVAAFMLAVISFKCHFGVGGEGGVLNAYYRLQTGMYHLEESWVQATCHVQVPVCHSA